MKFEVLGPLRVRLDGEVLALGGPKPRALLGILLLHPGEPVGVEELTEALWDGEPPASAAVNLRAYVRTLRRALEPTAGGDGGARLETRPPGYLLRVEPGELDLQDFEDLDTQARRALERGETQTAAGLWRQALNLWRGRPLADVRGGPRLDAAVVRLQERRLAAAEAWIDAQLALGQHAELVGELRSLTAAEPLHEPLWARLMVALHGTGRTADALAAYSQARQHLVDELGVEPGQQLQRLQRAILAGDAVVRSDGQPPGRPAAPAPPQVRLPEQPPPAQELCPYRGLMPFETVDAAWYYGREQLVAELVAYLSSQLTAGPSSPPSVLAVVGASGSGKSSLLRAGLLPALADGMLPAARDWPKVVLTPGVQPLAALTAAVSLVQPPGAPPPDPASLTDPRRFAALARRVLGPDPAGRRLVLVVDQLEELFTVCKDEHERQAFISALCTAAGSGGEGAAPAVVVLGLRADFYGHCIAYPELRPVLAGSQVVVGPMTEPELRHAIQRPAARSGLTLEPGLVEVLLADIGLGPDGGTRPEPGSLPLLSHALLSTWQLRDSDRLTVAGYRAAGGMHGAVATTAEAVYERLDASEQAIVRRLFTRLVALGEGTEDTSRRIRHDELAHAGADVGAVRRVLDALARARLIVVDASTIEVAHEALIKRWPRLQRWLTEDRDGLHTHRQLTDAATAWAALGHDPGALYRGARLAATRQWAETGDHAGDMNAQERAFLGASVELQASEQTTARRRTVRSRQLGAAVLVLLLLATTGGLLAVREGRRNAEQQAVARSQDLARRAVGLPAAQRPEAMLLAAEAFRTAPTPQARGALAALAPEDGYLDTLSGSGGPVTALAYSPDGTTLAAADQNGTVTLWDPAARTARATLTGDQTSASGVAFSPDGGLLAVAGRDGTVVLWDPRGGAQVGTLDAAGGPVQGVAFAPDGGLLASGGRDGTVVLWDPRGGARVGTLAAGGEPVTGVAFSPDSGLLAAGRADGTVTLWDVAGRAELATLTPSPRPSTSLSVEGLAFSPDGATLAAVQSTGTGELGVRETAVVLWDVRRRAQAALLSVPGLSGGSVKALAFSPDGATLAAGIEAAGRVVLWDTASRSHTATHRLGSGATVEAVAFSPDGTTLAAASADGGAVTLLDPAAPTIAGDSRIKQLTFSPDGTRLATSDGQDRIDLWDPTATEHVAGIEANGYPGGDLQYSPDGKWVAWSGWIDVVVWQPPGENSGVVLEALPRREGSIAGEGGLDSLGFSPDATKLFAADTYNDTLLVWTVEGGERTEREIPELANAALSPDGGTLATTTDTGAVTLWDFPDLGQPEQLTEASTAGTVPLVAFSPDGTTLAVVDGDRVTLWDVAERTATSSFSPGLGAIDIAVAPDGHTIALAGAEQVTLWDTAAGARLADFPTRLAFSPQLAFHPGGNRLATTDDGSVRFWDLDPQRAAGRICDTLGRSLTDAQWAELAPGQPYHATCG